MTDFGRLDLEHEVDRAHVDAELERRGRDQAGEVAGLQHLLHDQALLARERPVVGAGDVGGLAVLAGQVVQADGQPLGAAAVVDEDDRRAVLPYELEQLGIDRGPDRAARRRVRVALAEPRADQVAAAPGGADHPVGRVGDVVGARLAHVLDRNVDLQVERLADAGVDHRAVAPRTDQEPADLLERALRGRQADPLDRAAGQVLETLQRQRQVRAALGLRDGVDLVDDHPLDVGQDVARAGGEHQVQRLRRRDQHVRRLAQHLRRARAAGCRRCGSPPRCPRRCPSAARAGCARCRTPAPSAARRRPGASCARPRAAGRP